MLAPKPQILTPNGTKRNQPRNQAISLSFLNITRGRNQVEPTGMNPGTKLNPNALQICKTTNFDTQWNQVEPTPEPSHLPIYGRQK